jgi:hypothetical protein
MDHFGASACPTCRRPFEHLPDVCVPLHRFLARAFPVEYARRLRETHEEEETKECFSPSPALDLDLGALRLTDKKNHDDDDDDDDAKNASPLAFFDALERAPAVRGADDPALERVFLCGFRDDRTDGPDSEHAQETSAARARVARPGGSDVRPRGVRDVRRNAFGLSRRSRCDLRVGTAGSAGRFATETAQRPVPRLRRSRRRKRAARGVPPAARPDARVRRGETRRRRGRPRGSPFPGVLRPSHRARFSLEPFA